MTAAFDKTYRFPLYTILKNIKRKVNNMGNMDMKTYDSYKEALQAASALKDKEMIQKIEARLVADYGADHEDVRTLKDLYT